MRIREIRELAVPLSGDVANAVVNFAEHTVSLVAVVSDQEYQGKPVYGLAFNSIGRFAQSGLLRERFIPRLLAAEPETLIARNRDGLDPGAVVTAAMRNEKPGGHGDRAGAVAALELAVWDLNAKLNTLPACEFIAAHFGREPERDGTPVYAAGGYYYAEDSLEKLAEEMQQYTASGYTAVKMKIGGAALETDLKRIEAALSVLGDPARLAVDANARFNLREACRWADALAGFHLRWFEEPCDPLDYHTLSQVVATYPGVIATGENLFSAMDAENLLRFGQLRPGLDLLQMDPGLMYGLGEFARMLEHLETLGFERRQCVPHGGHMINLHIVTGLGLGGCEAYPGVFQPFGGYAPECQVRAGRVYPSAASGFGLEQKRELQPYLDQLVGDLL